MTVRVPRWARLDYGGAIGGLVGVALSVTPSLVPRPALLQGVIAGVSFGLGYALGALVFWLLARIIRWRPRARTRRIAWLILAATALVSLAILSAVALGWQNEVRRLVEMPELSGVDLGLFAAATVVTAIVTLLIGRGIRGLNLLFTRLSGWLALRFGPAGVRQRGAPSAVAASISGVFFTVVTVSALVLGLGAVAMSTIDSIYLARNGEVQEDIAEPGSEFRSAGPGSAVSWAALGRQGRAFVGGGPTADEIADATGTEAETPIRVYAGLAESPALDERAALAVDELERTGGFERSVLVVATSTGSGWLEPQSMDAIEYLHAGDTAIVSMQYAYTPSWVSFLFDQDLPVAASLALFDAVHERWSELPADHRPRLIAYGLSLGAHGMQSVFGGVDDIRDRTDGAVFVGSPNGTPLWNELQDSRDAGSPAWQPVVGGGSEVRWLSKRGDFDELPGEWTEPRVAYLQHATDPVTWLSPTLIWSAPEWLESDQRGPDVSPSMRWIPAVTGMQVLVDMLMGESVPARHGHNYGDVILEAWTAVAPNPELSDGALDRIQEIIEAAAPESPISE